MLCNQLRETLDDFGDGLLEADQQASLARHIDDCVVCRELHARATGLRQALRAYGKTVGPPPGYFDELLARAVRDGRRQQRDRWLITGVAAAVAIAIALAIVNSVVLQGAISDDNAGTRAAVRMTSDTPQTVHLVFSSDVALDDVTLTLLLPPGVELDGYAGQREISWPTDIVAGRNLLSLRLLARTATTGDLQAILEHDDGNRLFRVHIEAAQAGNDGEE